MIIETTMQYPEGCTPVVMSQLQLWFSGLSRPEPFNVPTVWLVDDVIPEQYPDISFADMSRIERAAFRALLNEAMARLDATEVRHGV